MPATLVDAMRAAGPAARHYDPGAQPVMELLRRTLKLRNVAELQRARSRISGSSCAAREHPRALPP